MLRRAAWITAAAVLAALLLQLVALPPVLRRLTFMPRPLSEELRSPHRWNLEADEVWIRAADGVRLHGWWIGAATAADRGCAAVLHLHGNAGNIGSRASLGRDLARRGHDVLLLDYRGFGASEGSASEAGLYRDAEAAYRFLVEQKQVPETDVVLIGHSLGSAVATELARGRPVGAVILAAPFTSLPEVVRTRLRIVPRWLLDWEAERFDALRDVEHIHAPVLMALGGEDGLVPRANARALYEAANEPKQWLDIQGADHNGLVGDRGFMDRVDHFIREHLACT